MMIAQKKEWLLLMFLFGMSLFIRNYQLNKKPNGFFCDEASIGLNAYKLLTNGKDEFGQKWPIFFRAFGEYKSPIQIYSSLPIIAIFGPKIESVRLVSAIWGSLTIIICFYLFKKISKKWAFFMILPFVVMPWHWHLSRIGFEMMPMIFFGILGINLWIDKKYYLAVMALCLASYSYFPARIYMPLLGLFFIIIDKKNIDIKKLLIVAMVIMWPMIIHMTIGQGMNRWQQVKGDFNFEKIAKNYWLHYSPDFLIIKGDAGMNSQAVVRHSVLGLGQIYWWQLAMALLGLFFGRKYNKKIWLISFFLLIIYPIGSVITKESSPQATRSSIGIIPVMIFSGIGINLVLEKIKWKNLLSILYLLMLFGSGIIFWKKYDLYETSGSKYMGWQSGMEENLRYLSSRQNDFDQLLVSHRFNETEILMDFLKLSINCDKCEVVSNPVRADGYISQLMALRPEDLEQLKNDQPEYEFKTEKIIYYGDGETAFLIGSPVKDESGF